MADQEKEIVVKITAKNLTASEFDKARRDIAGLGSAAEDQNKKSKGLLAGLGAFAKEHAESFKAVGAGLAIVTGAIGAAIGAVVALGQRGSTVNDLRQSFDQLNASIGNDSKAAIDTLDTAMDGTVSKFDLMTATNNALSQGLKVSVEDYKLLGESARVLADRVGGDTKTAYDTLITAMATGRDMTLKTIGLNIDAKQATEDYARSIGKTASELNEAEEKAAKQKAIMEALNGVMAESGRVTLDFGDAVDRAKTFVANFLDDLGAAIDSSAVLGAGLKAAGDALSEAFGGDQTTLIQTIVKWIEQAAITLVEWGRTGVTVVDVVHRSFKGLEVLFNAVAGSVAQLASWFFKLVEGVNYAISWIPGFSQSAGLAKDQAKELSTWLKGASDGFFKQGAAALDAVQGNSEFHATLDKVDAGLGKVRNAMVDAMATQTQATATTEQHSTSMKGNAAAVTQANKALDEYNKKLRDLTQVLATVGPNADPKLLTQQYGNAIKDIVAQASLLGEKVPETVLQAFLKVSLTEAGEHIAKEVEQINKKVEEQNKAALEKRNEAVKKNLEISVEAYKNAEDIKNKMSLNSFEYQKTLIERERQEKIAALDKTAMGYEMALESIALETDAKMAEAEAAWKAHLAEMKAATNSWGNLFQGWLRSIPDLLQKAFAGGGGFSGALKGLFSGIGGDIGEKIFGGPNGLGNKLAQGLLGKGMGAGLAGQLGSIVGMIGGPLGSLMGPAIMKGVGWVGGKLKDLFGGPSKKELAGREAVGGFEDQIRATLTDQQKLEAGGERWKETVIGVRDAFRETGRSEQEALAAVDALWAASKKGPEEAARVYNEQILPAMTQVQEQQAQAAADQERANELMSKYGISIEETGGKFRNARMKEIGEGLVADFTDLVGILDMDMDSAIGKMGDSINDFIGKAIKTGTEVPAAMKPMLERMIEMGTLTDADGNKITSLEGSGISFSESMTEGFSKVVDRMDALLKGLGIEFPAALETAAGSSKELANELMVTGEAGSRGIQKIKDAIAGIPRDISVEVNGEWNPPDIPGDQGFEVPSFANEGFVPRATLAMVGDVPGGEFVLKPSTIRDLMNTAAQVSGGARGGATTISFVVNTITASADPLRQLVQKELMPLLIEAINGNKGGSQTELRHALGIA